MRLALKVQPRASENAVAGWENDVLKVRVTAPPKRGKANEAVVRLLADVLGLPRGAVRVVRGETTRQKLVEVDGLSEAELRTRLSRP